MSNLVLKRSGRKSIIDYIHSELYAKADSMTSEQRNIRGIWLTEYVAKLNPAEVSVHYCLIAIQTVGYGCSFFDSNLLGDSQISDWLGCDALEVQNAPLPIRIAALDAVASSHRTSPSNRYTISGTSFEKASYRARLIVDEVLRPTLSPTTRSSGKRVIAVIGVVGAILYEFSLRQGIEVVACDMAPALIGSVVHGTTILPGIEASSLIAQSDIALVTGMTLATGTLDNIIDTALANGTKIVVFAQTGASFSSLYCAVGADSVICEPYPFYALSNEPSIVEVYRR